METELFPNPVYTYKLILTTSTKALAILECGGIPRFFSLQRSYGPNCWLQHHASVHDSLSAPELSLAQANPSARLLEGESSLKVVHTQLAIRLQLRD
jgi:hypothetical protein